MDYGLSNVKIAKSLDALLKAVYAYFIKRPREVRGLEVRNCCVLASCCAVVKG